jgi:hypothetical protein
VDDEEDTPLSPNKDTTDFKDLSIPLNQKNSSISTRAKIGREALDEKSASASTKKGELCVHISRVMV